MMDKLFKAVSYEETGRRDMVPQMVQQSVVGCDPGGPSKESRLCQPRLQYTAGRAVSVSTNVLILGWRYLCKVYNTHIVICTRPLGASGAAGQARTSFALLPF
jgi:hypothetical protein